MTNINITLKENQKAHFSIASPAPPLAKGPVWDQGGVALTAAPDNLSADTGPMPAPGTPNVYVRAHARKDNVSHAGRCNITVEAGQGAPDIVDVPLTLTP